MLSTRIIDRKGQAAFGEQWRQDPALRGAVHGLAKPYISELGSLQALGPADKAIRRARVYWLLRSYRARAVSVILSWNPRFGLLDLERVSEVAEAIDPRRDCGEPIHAWFEPKSSTGFRPICSFGPKRRALQRLVRDVLEAAWGISPYEFAREGRGRDRAVQGLMNAIEVGGARWVHRADVQDCFSSMNQRGLVQVIPLPRAVVENVVLIPETAKVTLHLEDELDQPASEKAVRRGIPQGSLASSLIVGMVFKSVLDDLPGILRMSHGDDIVTATKSAKECETNRQALEDALRLHPVGPLLMKYNTVTKMGRPLDVLGYRLRWRWKMFGGGVRAVPSPEAFTKWERRLTTRLSGIVDKASVAQISTDYTARWRAAFRLWERSDMGEEQLDNSRRWLSLLKWMHSMKLAKHAAAVALNN